MLKDQVLTVAEVNEALDLIYTQPVLAMQNAEIKRMDAHLWTLARKWRGDFKECVYGAIKNSECGRAARFVTVNV